MGNQYVQQPLRERVFSKLIITPAPEGISVDGPCLLWSGSRRRGYGQTTVGGHYGKNWLVHRLVWEMLEGPVPSGMTLDHLCGVLHCASIAHLEPVTAKVNILRGKGPAAINARKTQCIRGHDFDAIRPDGARECRTCKRARNKEWDARRPPRNRRRSA
jgi:hypothetical protein